MGLWSVMVAPWRSLLQVEGFSCVGEGWAVQGLGWGLFLFFFTGVANCGVGWREEERSYFTGESTDTQNEGKGSETAGHSYWEFPALGISAVHSSLTVYYVK